MTYLIAGWGRSGKAVASCLEQEGQAYIVFDEKVQGAGVYNQINLIPWATIEQIVLSPGFALDHALIADATVRGIAVISEIEFAFRRCQGPVIAVTGSNGKSSTVTMLESIFLQTDRAVQLCGNIGRPFTEAVMAAPQAVFVVEVSSFQLETIDTFRPRVGILLNVTPDHIDRHGSFEAYKQAKLNLFRNQGPGDLALVPPYFKDALPGQARVERVHPPQLEGVVFQDNDQAVKVTNPALRPPHQQWNARFAAFAAKELGVDVTTLELGFKAFQGLKHRMEWVGNVAGRTWINDSKATNIDSTQVAIDAMEGPFILILGGKNKDADFSTLDFSKGMPKALILYGQAGPELQASLNEFHPEVIDLFDEAVNRAWELSAEGDTILLSPGCASFDQFKGFEKRGDAFRELFHAIQKKVGSA